MMNVAYVPLNFIIKKSSLNSKFYYHLIYCYSEYNILFYNFLSLKRLNVISDN